jgi:hypothetical protein
MRTTMRTAVAAWTRASRLQLKDETQVSYFGQR